MGSEREKRTGKYWLWRALFHQHNSLLLNDVLRSSGRSLAGWAISGRRVPLCRRSSVIAQSSKKQPTTRKHSLLVQGSIKVLKLL